GRGGRVPHRDGRRGSRVRRAASDARPGDRGGGQARRRNRAGHREAPGRVQGAPADVHAARACRVVRRDAAAQCERQDRPQGPERRAPGQVRGFHRAMTTSIHFPDHAPIHAFDRAGGELVIGGVPLSRLAARIGRTPFYAYSREAISARVAELRAALPEAVRLHYAMKANPMPALVAHLVGLTDGIDVASAQEMHVALDAGADPGHMSFAGPGKTPEEISRAIAAGVAINLESEGQ